MEIEQLFQDDINRKINGVVKVGQDSDAVLVQELEEYVITKDLKKHFANFFRYYADSFRTPTDDIGVWISGFFGSGKSHFLKMLSYLLANEEVQGRRTVERFRRKLADDPKTFSLIEQVTKGSTDTILFNIDEQAGSNKDKTAVLRVFAKMFYNHLGFYGSDLKVVQLERYVDRQGKTDTFRRVFEEIYGAPWTSSRETFAFLEDEIVATMVRVLGMSEESARRWFDDNQEVEISIADLVSDMKVYLHSQPADYRLLFMIDEVGQYVGGDKDMLLNLQTLTEKIGTDCEGKVWIICTGQEAIDEVIKTRMDEFSRIQARFKIRLSLTSSSADEVIQKRILKKKPEAKPLLEDMYRANDSVLKNLFTFSGALMDIKGYSDAKDYVKNFPFVPYQFLVMQKVFTEIRKHGNSGKHLSAGERSMLSGFQEAAQKIEHKDEHALAPFYLFYDTVHTFLDSSIRLVIDRCQRAADRGEGILPEDVNVLKLLYLIRYVDDIPSNLDNLVILMADDIRLDKVEMRTKVQKSLDRLLSQNYIGKSDDTYQFLTDEEQDIQKEIYSNTVVDTADVVTEIGKTIFADIYSTKKYRLGNYDFPFNQKVDDMSIGTVNGGDCMCLRVLTAAADPEEKMEMTLWSSSKRAVVVILADLPYYESLQRAMQVEKYVKGKNVYQLSQSAKNIISQHQQEAARLKVSAKETLARAIEEGSFYVDGEKLSLKSGDAKSKLNQALEQLVSHVYSKLGLIEKQAESDADILAVLRGDHLNGVMEGMEANHDAAIDMEQYLEMQGKLKLKKSMADLQTRYQAPPFGWKEIDVAQVAAMLLYGQKATLKYAGEIVSLSDKKLPDYLRKKSLIGKVIIEKRQVISAEKLKKARKLLVDYLGQTAIPSDEDGLVAFAVEKLEDAKRHYETLLARYEGHKYPKKEKVQDVEKLVDQILWRKKDNNALIAALLDKADDLLDSKDDMEEVEIFFDKQVGIFDDAVALEKKLTANELDYIKTDEETNQALNGIRKIVLSEAEKPILYKHIPELTRLMQTVKEGYGRLLDKKREEIRDIIHQCRSAIHVEAQGKYETKSLVSEMDRYYDGKEKSLDNFDSLLALDGLKVGISASRNSASKRIDYLLRPKPVAPAVVDDTPKTPVPAPKKKLYKDVWCQAVFTTKTLESEKDIDDYLQAIRRSLLKELQGYDGIKLK